MGDEYGAYRRDSSTENVHVGSSWQNDAVIDIL